MNRLMAAVLAGAIIGTIGARSYGGDWETDFEKASAAAGESGMYMLLDFSGSDWCGWCIKLTRRFCARVSSKFLKRTWFVCWWIFRAGRNRTMLLKPEQGAGEGHPLRTDRLRAERATSRGPEIHRDLKEIRPAQAGASRRGCARGESIGQAGARG